MKPNSLNRKISRLCLILVPILVAITGFSLGMISYTIYLPIWLINVLLMVMASRVLGLHVMGNKTEKSHLAAGAFFLIMPEVLVSMFFGLGPPPEAATVWVRTG